MYLKKWGTKFGVRPFYIATFCNILQHIATLYYIQKPVLCALEDVIKATVQYVPNLGHGSMKYLVTCSAYDPPPELDYPPPKTGFKLTDYCFLLFHLGFWFFYRRRKKVKKRRRFLKSIFCFDIMIHLKIKHLLF